MAYLTSRQPVIRCSRNLGFAKGLQLATTTRQDCQLSDTKIGRGGRIRTGDPLSPRQVPHKLEPGSCPPTRRPVGGRTTPGLLSKLPSNGEQDALPGSIAMRKRAVLVVETGENRTPRPMKGPPEVLQAFPTFILVQRAVAGPASPDRADSLRRLVSASNRSTPANRRRTTARQG